MAARSSAASQLAAAALSRDGGADAARGIMTTDPFPKEAAVESSAPTGTFRVGGIAKGSGHDRADDGDDARLRHDRRRGRAGAAAARAAAAVDDTFNAITVDGECSTNDCVFALASGASGVTLERGRPTRCSSRRCAAACEPLAIGIVRGGEGATKLITVDVTGGALRRRRQARGARDRQLAAGEDGDPRRRSRTGAGWSRSPDAPARRSRSTRAACGSATSSCSATAARSTSARRRRPTTCRARDRRVRRPRHRRAREARMWTCDLSAEYVRINAEYRT